MAVLEDMFNLGIQQHWSIVKLYDSAKTCLRFLAVLMAYLDYIAVQENKLR